MIELGTMQVLFEGGDDSHFVRHFVKKTLGVDFHPKDPPHPLVNCGDKNRALKTSGIMPSKSNNNLPHRLFKDDDLHKAELRNWLAWQNEPGAPIGVSVNLKPSPYNFNHPSAQAFANWWREVLDIPRP